MAGGGPPRMCWPCLRCLLMPPSSTEEVTDADHTVEEWQGFDQARHETFVRDFWQKRPLLIRNAFPKATVGCGVDRRALFEWAKSEDVETRLVRLMVPQNAPTLSHEVFNPRSWTTEFGPLYFEEDELEQDLQGSRLWWAYRGRRLGV